MKLIREFTGDTVVEIVTEEGSKEKRHFVTGVTMQADIVNKNGRKYPLNILQREADRYTKSMIKTNRALGELKHPNSPFIDPERAAIKFQKLQLDGTNFISKAMVLNTPMGKIVSTLLDDKVKLGISSRALGTLKPDGDVKVVQEDLHLITPGDIVHDPSAPDAFVEGVYENAEYEFVDGMIVEKLKDKLDKEYKLTMTAEEKIDKIAEAFQLIIDELVKK